MQWREGKEMRGGRMGCNREREEKGEEGREGEREEKGGRKGCNAWREEEGGVRDAMEGDERREDGMQWREGGEGRGELRRWEEGGWDTMEGGRERTHIYAQYTHTPMISLILFICRLLESSLARMRL